MSIAGCEEKADLERRGFRPNFLVNSVANWGCRFGVDYPLVFRLNKVIPRQWEACDL